jgi:hypothetical protein
VAARTREHFFLDTKSIEGAEKGDISMGMCGSVVMRHGKCVGMLTAKVHDDSPTTELAGMSMCTYARDIFEFCLEVERQMKNPSPVMDPNPTRFSERREAEGKRPAEHVDYELHETRLARHVKTSSALWHMEESFMTQEDIVTSSAFGRSGVFNQETQENILGLDMNQSKVGERPEGVDVFGPGANGKPEVQTMRRDDGPTGIYVNKSEVPRDTMWDARTQQEMKNLFEGNVQEKDAVQLTMLRQQLEAHRAEKEQERMAQTAVRSGSRAAAGKADTEDVWGAKHSVKETAYGGRTPGTDGRDFQAIFTPEVEDSATGTHAGNAGDDGGQYTRTARTIEKAKEEAYSEELRRRHQQKPRPFGDDEGLGGSWGQH